jgi:hypothetical protein
MFLRRPPHFTPNLSRSRQRDRCACAVQEVETIRSQKISSEKALPATANNRQGFF